MIHRLINTKSFYFQRQQILQVKLNFFCFLKEGTNKLIFSRSNTTKETKVNNLELWPSKQKLPKHSLGSCIANNKGQIFFVSFKPITIYNYNDNKNKRIKLYSNSNIMEFCGTHNI